MNYAVYQTIVSKIGTVIPLFGKALVDMALKRHGFTVESISPVEMLELIKTEINPRLADRMKSVSTVLDAGAGLAQADELDRIIQANSVVRRMAGQAAFELPSAELFRLLQWRGFIRPAREVEALEIREVRASEIGKIFSVSLCPVWDAEGRRCGVMSIVQDITIREAIEADIVRFQTELHNVIQCIGDALIVVDPSGCVVRTNPAADVLYGDGVGLRGHAVESLFSFRAAREPAGLLATLEAQGELRDRDASFLPAHGKPVPVLLSGAILRDGAGARTGTLLSAKDMRLQRELSAKVVNSSKMAALGEMAGGIAHEINNPLTVIQGRASQLRRMSADGTLDAMTVTSFAQKIEATTQRIARIVRGLRSFAYRGEQDEKQPTALRTIVEDTLEFCRERFRSHGVTLRVPEVSEAISISCRPTEITQVLLNLLSNAFDAVEKALERWVELRVDASDSTVTITVLDSGPGVPRELRDQMFQPFFTTKPINKGTGLGLSISQGIVHDHGGTLLYDETSARTCFRVQLPRASA